MVRVLQAQMGWASAAFQLNTTRTKKNQIKQKTTKIENTGTLDSN